MPPNTPNLHLPRPPLQPHSSLSSSGFRWGALAPVVLIRLAVGFVEALTGPAAVGVRLVGAPGRVGGSVPVRGGRGGAVAVGHAARVGVPRRPWRPRWPGWWGTSSSSSSSSSSVVVLVVSGSPGGARLRLLRRRWGVVVMVRVAPLLQALLVGRRLVVALVLVVGLIEGPVPLQAVLWGRPGPAPALVVVVVPRRAWRTVVVVLWGAVARPGMVVGGVGVMCS